jgi:hypothetical protein
VLKKKIRAKRDVTVTICLTERQKTAIEELSDTWDIDMATICRKLVQLLLNKKTALSALLEKYHAVHKSEMSAFDHDYTNPDWQRKIHRICIRLTHEEKQELNILADEDFHLPGEIGGIMVELFLSGVIKKSDLWG